MPRVVDARDTDVTKELAKGKTGTPKSARQQEFQVLYSYRRIQHVSFPPGITVSVPQCISSAPIGTDPLTPGITISSAPIGTAVANSSF